MRLVSFLLDLLGVSYRLVKMHNPKFLEAKVSTVHSGPSQLLREFRLGRKWEMIACAA